MRFLLTIFILALPLLSPDIAALRFDLAPRQTVENRLRRTSNDNTRREDLLKQMFSESGCRPPALVEQPVERESLPNVVCKLNGRTKSVIVVGAHFDHVRTGQGIVDNWSGASLLPTLYGSVHNVQRKHTFLFIGFTDEESGLIGSKYYVAHLTPDQVASIRAMVNLDSLGIQPTKIFLSHSNQALYDDFERVAKAMKLPAEVVNVKGADEDSEPFMKRGIPTLMLHSVTPPTWRILHSPQDTIQAVDMSAYYDSYHLIAAYLAYLDSKLN